MSFNYSKAWQIVKVYYPKRYARYELALAASAPFDGENTYSPAEFDYAFNSCMKKAKKYAQLNNINLYDDDWSDWSDDE